MHSDSPAPARIRGQQRGRRVDSLALAQIRQLLGTQSRERELLIEHLHRIQDRYHALSTDHLHALASEMKLSQVEVYEVASFYHHFDLLPADDAPAAELTIRVCDSLSCHLAGANRLVEQLDAHFNGPVRVCRSPCLGRCHQAPAVMVGEHAVPQASVATIDAAIEAKQIVAGLPAEYIGYDEYVEQGGYKIYKSCRNDSRSVEEIVTALEQSGLRGLGGAGFAAASKWRIVRSQPAPRYLAVNIDEGEPGTFKDRFFLEKDPHRLLEGVLIAAWAIAAEAIYLYLRNEYPHIRLLLQQELARLANEHDFDLPPIHLRRGAGSYVCGEESALIESLEGKRGMPRLRPPYVAECGLFGQPTLQHNMETLYWVRDILEKGAEWYSEPGRRGRQGLRSFSVSGRVNRPGVYRAPAGISVRELIDEYGGGMPPGHRLYGYFPGGASGGMLPASLDRVPLDFDTLEEFGCFIGSAAVIVFSQQDSARDLALNAMSFFAAESCGQCTPCRVGTHQAVQQMQQPSWNQALLTELCQVMQDGSICGLGQAAANPLLCAIKYFPEEFE